MEEEKNEIDKSIELKIRSFGMVQSAHIEISKFKISNPDFWINPQIFKDDAEKISRMTELLDKYHTAQLEHNGTAATTILTEIANSKCDEGWIKGDVGNNNLNLV